MKTLRIAAVLLFLAGTVLTARAAYLRVKAELAGILIRHAWNESIKMGHPHPPWPSADTHPVARLQIPHLGYDEIVLDAATPRALAFGPARLHSSAALGERGNLVLAGHRTSWFRPLAGIRQGDKIQLDWFDPHHGGLRSRTYTVTMIRVVNPLDVSLLQPTSESALTLITCYPFGSSPHSPLRFIVRAQ